MEKGGGWKSGIHTVIDKCFFKRGRETGDEREGRERESEEIRSEQTKEPETVTQWRRLAIFAKLSELNRIMSSR
jgi:hypothetical protein